jgi:hypothetical protein
MAVSSNQLTTRRDEGRIGVPVAANKRLYEGTLCFAASGLASDVIGTNGVNPFLGILVREADNTGGLAAATKAELLTCGQFLLTGAGFAQTDVGKLAYGVDNFAVSPTATNQPFVGTITEFVSATQVWVEINRR